MNYFEYKKHVQEKQMGSRYGDVIMFVADKPNLLKRIWRFVFGYKSGYKTKY